MTAGRGGTRFIYWELHGPEPLLLGSPPSLRDPSDLRQVDVAVFPPGVSQDEVLRWMHKNVHALLHGPLPLGF